MPTITSLAATASTTKKYFHQNRIAEYNHERAVADGVNVGYDVYRSKTRVTAQGGTDAKSAFDGGGGLMTVGCGPIEIRVCTPEQIWFKAEMAD